ncbi:peptidyl-tRNA hydrolase 2, mitochondrial isoform X1 [Dendroctonus ponderosae]|uniref:peptidyl-tRNA hydrolase n=1 Tax=Dendroctonus ponderosae TaxID=77166 RepID=J3JWV5_DENPD|nr:peptidyl-tRNA hydrolase 2, mitochondrial isoform X1 [Dendroctonus ponderosae]AEE62685.1 unknown [Dendroctonus ponderosae]ERL85015.1 hypothetical protein D910_02438 [Dendroctonus ponderosae]KAH1011070.1 hypothetical protein HUJ04_000512 [Dendroctonus ponderosae]KAH1019016.1 hypothetical protein HUJ05_006683 [Dendroctonus ponderosae]
MGMIASNAYLAAFSAGTVVGIASTYVFLKFRNNWHTQHENKVKQDPLIMEEKYEFENTDDEIRLILGVRNDLKMQKGKVAAQCGHASMDAFAKVYKKSPELLKSWLKTGGTKIVVRVDSEAQLFELNSRAKNLNVFSCIICDAGHTQVDPGSRTVIAIGPARKSVLEQITGDLKLY